MNERRAESGVRQDAQGPRPPEDRLLLPIVAASAVWLVKVAYLGLVPLRALAMSPWLIDDSFIIMRIARNVALGRGFSFDGVHPTSGAPLLWTTVTAVNHLWAGRDLAATLTLVESAFFGTLCAVFVFRLARRFSTAPVAWASFVFVLMAAPFAANSMNGMETGLFAFVGLAAIDFYVGSFQARPGDRRWAACRLGVLLGLATLVRADGVFVAGAILAREAVMVWRSSERRTAVVAMACLAATFALCILPELLWSWHATGTMAPANEIGRRHLAWSAALGTGRVSLLAYVAVVWSHVRYLRFLVAVMTGSGVVAMVAVADALLRRGGALPWVTAGYVLSFLAALAAYQGYFPDVHGVRYLNLSGMLLVIVVFEACTAAMRRLGRREPSRVVLAMIVAVLMTSSTYQYVQLTRSLPWAAGMHLVPTAETNETTNWWAFQDWAATLPPGTSIAAKDHGLLAYFTDVRVIDLAGIIDPRIIGAMDTGTVGRYLTDAGAQYVLLPDPDPADRWTVFHAIRSSVHVTLVPGVPPQQTTGDRLYRIDPSTHRSIE